MTFIASLSGGPLRAPPLVLSLHYSTAIHTLLLIHTVLTYTDTCIQHIIIMHTDNTQCAVYIDELSSYSPQSFHI